MCSKQLVAFLCSSSLAFSLRASLKCGWCIHMLYSHNDNIDLRTSINKHFYKNISLTLYSRKGWCFCGVWEMGGETYTQREDFFFLYLLPGAKGCQRLHPLASSSEMPLIDCMSLARRRFSARCLNLTMWFSSRGLVPVTHLLDLSALILLSSLLITWQLVKAHRVTWNEPKIHGICYKTHTIVVTRLQIKNTCFIFSQRSDFHMIWEEVVLSLSICLSTHLSHT